MVLEIFQKPTFTLRISECSFGETVSCPIVLSVDMGERQVLKADNDLFCLPTPMKEIWWGEHSRSHHAIDDYLRITVYMSKGDPHHLGREKKCP